MKVNQEPETKKITIKLTHDEYERMGRRILAHMKDLEKQGQVDGKFFESLWNN